jgi:hypothetical protein
MKKQIMYLTTDNDDFNKDFGLTQGFVYFCNKTADLDSALQLPPLYIEEGG